MQLTDSTLLRTQSFIGGEWVDADSGATFVVTNPADLSPICSVAALGAAETARFLLI